MSAIRLARRFLEIVIPRRPSTLHSKSPRNSMHLQGPLFLCGAHWSPRAANSASSNAIPFRVSSSLSPITRTSSTKT